jgi:dTDP-4-amino-4,6-dideoxygalactose transaminase
VGTAIGPTALEISLCDFEVGPGDEVTAIPRTALLITRARATPALADIDPVTALLEVSSAKRWLTPDTKAMMWGRRNVIGSGAPAWELFATEHDLLLIKDCPRAHVATVSGRTIGSLRGAAV